MTDNSYDEDAWDFIQKLPGRPHIDPNERYANFRKTFRTAHGKKVLAEIINWAKMLRPATITTPVDPNAILIDTGQKNLAAKILVTYLKEPPQKADTQTRKE